MKYYVCVREKGKNYESGVEVLASSKQAALEIAKHHFFNIGVDTNNIKKTTVTQLTT